MNPDLRTCIAYVAGCLITGTTPHQVFDKARNLRVRMKGSIKGGVVEVFDYERNCKFMGSLPTLFDFGTDTAFSLEISGKNFSGRDKHAEQYIAGTVEGKRIKLHDYGQARDFYYELGEV